MHCKSEHPGKERTLTTSRPNEARLCSVASGYKLLEPVKCKATKTHSEYQS